MMGMGKNGQKRGMSNEGELGHNPQAASVARAADMLSSEVGEEGTIEIFEMFLRDAMSRMDDIAAAHRNGDAAEMRRSAHSFKSVCETVGAGEFAGILRDIEKIAEMGNFEVAQKFIARADEELPEVVALLEVEVERMRERMG